MGGTFLDRLRSQELRTGRKYLGIGIDGRMPLRGRRSSKDRKATQE